MREDHIALVKKHFLANPKYKYSLEDLKENMLSIGVSEAEFEEAVRQVTGAPSKPAITARPKSIPHISIPKSDENHHESAQGQGIFSSKKLLELDIATHIAVILILFMSVSLFGYTFFAN
jgi:hypothetical protein